MLYYAITVAMAGLQLLVLVSAIAVSLASFPHVDIEEFVVEYEVSYPDSNCPSADGSNAPLSATVTVPRGSNALTVLELAVDVGREYRFSATYFGQALGYFIDTINGTTSDLQQSCFWFFYTKAANSDPYKPNFGVSNFLIPVNGTKIVFQYEKYVPDGSHDNASTDTSSVKEKDDKDQDADRFGFSVNLFLRTPNPSCPPATTLPNPVCVTIPRGGSALNVLENARNKYNAYKFSATYYGQTLGYFIDSLAGTGSPNDTCFWAIYYQPPNGNPYYLSFGASNFVPPVDGGNLIFQYQAFDDDQETDPVLSVCGGDDNDDNGDDDDDDNDDDDDDDNDADSDEIKDDDEEENSADALASAPLTSCFVVFLSFLVFSYN